VHAWADVLGTLRHHRQGLPAFIVHAFGASAEILRDLLKLGGCPSFWLKDLERRAEKMKPLLRTAAADGFLLETDFPNCRYDGAADIAASYFDCLERLYRNAAALLGGEEKELKDEVFDNGTVFADAAAAR
jgi:Tat protein secretion system quality control protein TatD with DNase activity